MMACKRASLLNLVNSVSSKGLASVFFLRIFSKISTPKRKNEKKGEKKKAIVEASAPT